MDEIDPDNIFEKIKVERDPISVEFENQISELNWESEKSSTWKSIELIPFTATEISDSVVEVNIDNYEYLEVTAHEQNDFINLVRHIDKAGSTSFTPRVNLRVNIIDLLFHAEKASQLFTDMISNFSKNYCKLPFDTTHKILSLKILSLFAIHKSYNLKTVIDADLDILCMTYRTGKLTYIELEDYQEIVSRAYIDRDFCQRLPQMTRVREQFNNYYKGRQGFLNDNGDLIEIHLEDNFQLFQFVNRAKALFRWEDVLQVWALYVIPYQVFFRENHSSIFNPFYLEKCGLA
jgi:hypothetical protein